MINLDPPRPTVVYFVIHTKMEVLFRSAGCKKGCMIQTRVISKFPDPNTIFAKRGKWSKVSTSLKFIAYCLSPLHWHVTLCTINTRSLPVSFILEIHLEAWYMCQRILVLNPSFQICNIPFSNHVTLLGVLNIANHAFI